MIFSIPSGKGKSAWIKRNTSGMRRRIQYWGKEKAPKFHRVLAKQGVQWNRGHTMISQLVAAGEFPLGIVYAHRIESMKKAGAPVEWVKTADPVFVTVSPVAVAAKARHPTLPSF